MSSSYIKNSLIDSRNLLERLQETKKYKQELLEYKRFTYTD